MSSLRPYMNSNALAGYETMDPRLRARTAALINALDPSLREKILISDTTRTWPQQVAAAKRHGVDPLTGKPGMLAPWGQGKHHAARFDNGLTQALDFYGLSGEQLRSLRKMAPEYGLRFPEWGRLKDPWHMELDPGWKGTLKSMQQNAVQHGAAPTGPNMAQPAVQVGAAPTGPEMTNPASDPVPPTGPELGIDPNMVPPSRGNPTGPELGIDPNMTPPAQAVSPIATGSTAPAPAGPSFSQQMANHWSDPSRSGPWALANALTG